MSAVSNVFKDKEKRRIIIISMSAGIVIAYLFFAVPPQLKAITSASGSMQQARESIRSIEMELDKTSAYQRYMATYKSKARSYKGRLLSQDSEIPNLLESLSNMAKSSGLKIVGIKPVRFDETCAASKGAMYREVPISITAKAGYHELGKFISQMENSETFIKVSDISVISGGASSKKHDVTLLLSAYILSAEANNGG